MGVAISSGSSLTLTAPHTFFRMPTAGFYQVANDGQRLLMSVPEEDEAQTSIHLIINWPEDFRTIN